MLGGSVRSAGRRGGLEPWERPVEPWNRRTGSSDPRMSGEERAARPGDQPATATRETAGCTPTTAWPSPLALTYGEVASRSFLCREQASSGGGMSQAALGPEPSFLPTTPPYHFCWLMTSAGWAGVGSSPTRRGQRAGVPLSLAGQRCYPVRPSTRYMLASEGTPEMSLAPPPANTTGVSPGHRHWGWPPLPPEQLFRGPQPHPSGHTRVGLTASGCSRHSPPLSLPLPRPVSVRSPFWLLCLQTSQPQGD